MFKFRFKHDKDGNDSQSKVNRAESQQKYDRQKWEKCHTSMEKSLRIGWVIDAINDDNIIIMLWFLEYAELLHYLLTSINTLVNRLPSG